MRLSVTHDEATETTSICFASNCHTDAVPLVDRAIFYNAAFDVTSPAAALAGAVLFADYCGESLEFDGLSVSLDLVAGLQRMLPQVRAVTPVDSMRRDLFRPGIEIACAEAGRDGMGRIALRGGSVQLSRLSWSGDFPVSPPEERGAIFTNAMLVAQSSTRVSIAMALLAAGNGASRLHVEAGPDEDFSSVVAGLRMVGVELCVHAAGREIELRAQRRHG